MTSCGTAANKGEQPSGRDIAASYLLWPWISVQPFLGQGPPLGFSVLTLSRGRVFHRCSARCVPRAQTKAFPGMDG